MYPYIHIILPSYFVMAFIGGFVTLCFVYFRLDKYNIEFTFFLKAFILTGIGVFLGSKVLFAITQLPWLFNNFTISNILLLIPRSGFVFYGGLFGALVVLLYITRKNKGLRKSVLFLTVPAIPLFHCFGRIGCYLSGCCYGKKLNNAINLEFLKINRMPVQIIEAIAEFMIFIVLLLVIKKRRVDNILSLYLVMYAIVRFFDEFLRGDKVRGIWYGFSTAQWISMGILVYYFIFLVKRMKSRNLE